MNLNALDWLIVALVLLVLGWVAWITRRLNRSVADFLAANRSAGRYLLTMAEGMAGLGAITIAANFEQFYQAGFAAAWWGQMLAPIGLILALSGFVIYRFRETRSLTLAQFLEMRYSRRFRVFAGLVIWLSGILNYGIFPGVTARFIVYFTGLPPEIHWGTWAIPTIAPVMIFMLGVALAMTLGGGQITVMLTDFLQGQFVNIAALALLAVLFYKIGWTDLIEGLRQAPENQSRLDPFQQSQIADFNVFYYLIAAFTLVYGHRAWQGTQGFNAAARSPHEARMAGILAQFRGLVTATVFLLIPIAMYAMLHLPQFADQQAQVEATLSGISSPQLQEQMRVPVALSTILPGGIMGLFAAVVFTAAISTDNAYLHSWGSIFIQDVVLPLRNKPLPPRRHIRLLRWSIVSVAVFGFTFSLTFPLNDYILMYFAVTGAIYGGGAGAVIIGGLYWRRGTVEGAWAAMITGGLLAVTGIVLQNVVWPFVLPELRATHADWAFLRHLPPEFPLNGVEISFVAAVSAIGMYVLFSLLSRREPVNMDKLLHRGRWAVEVEGHQPGCEPGAGSHAAPMRRHQVLCRWLGITDEFTRGDTFIYFFKIGWTLLFFGVFVVGTAVGLVWGVPEEAWIAWWGFTVALSVVLSVVFVVWFLIGGAIDFLDLVRALRSTARNERDDGTVPAQEHVQVRDTQPEQTTTEMPLIVSVER